jgi:hypothetical protein
MADGHRSGGISSTLPSGDCFERMFEHDMIWRRRQSTCYEAGQAGTQALTDPTPQVTNCSLAHLSARNRGANPRRTPMCNDEPASVGLR